MTDDGISAKEFSRWLASASPGETIVYHVGDCAESDTCDMARHASERGLVFLAQRRRPGGLWRYEATRISEATRERLASISERESIRQAAE